MLASSKLRMLTECLQEMSQPHSPGGKSEPEDPQGSENKQL